MISGFFLDSDFSASSPVAIRRAVVLKARRAINEAIGAVLVSGMDGGGVELLSGGRVGSLDVLSYD